MSKSSTLDWWLKFAQTDLKSVYKKTRSRLRLELMETVNEYTSDPCEGRAESIGFADMEEYKEGALLVAKALIDPDLPRPRGRIQYEEEMEGLTSCTYVVCDYLNKGETATGLVLRALREADITSKDQISICPVCEHVFVQNTIVRKRQYCSTQCRNKGNKAKEEEKFLMVALLQSGCTPIQVVKELGWDVDGMVEALKNLNAKGY